MKTLKKVLVFVLVISLCSGFFACNTAPKKLEMTAIHYDDITKVLSWKKVDGATNYSVRIGASAQPSSTITEKNGMMQMVLKESGDATYKVYIIAKGDGKKYSNSATKQTQIEYTKKRKLFMTEISFDREARLLTWDKVENASGYTLAIGNEIIGDVQKPAISINTRGERVRHFMNEVADGSYKISVIAKGDGVDFGDSDPEIINVTDYEKVNLAIVRERMQVALTEFVGRESAAFDYDFSTDGGIIMSENSVFRFANMGLDMPAASGEAYLSEAELYLLTEEKQYMTLPNILDMFTVGGQIPDDAVVAARDDSEGYTLRFEFNQARLGDLLDVLFEAANGLFADFEGYDIAGMSIESITLDSMANPEVIIDFDPYLNITNVYIKLQIYGFANFVLSGLPASLPVLLDLKLNLKHADRVVPDNMPAYLEANGYKPMEMNFEMPF